MSFKRIIRYFWLGMLALLAVYACTSELEPILDEESLSIELYWSEGLLLDNRDELITGITWAMSSLGAELRTGSIARAVTFQTNNELNINFQELGFNDRALRAIHRVLTELKGSEEYQQQGYVPLGRLIMLLLNSSYHYYEITQVPETLSEFRNLYNFDGKEVAVVESTITTVHRLLEVAEASQYAQIAHIGSESGNDFLPGVKFEPKEFEVMDLMANDNFALPYMALMVHFALLPMKDLLLPAGRQNASGAMKWVFSHSFLTIRC